MMAYNFRITGMVKKKKETDKKPDRRQIDIHNEWEVDYWSQRLGCSHQKLIEAVKIAGTSPIKVARQLEKIR
jgi:hypothetical protein